VLDGCAFDTEDCEWPELFAAAASPEPVLS